MGNLLEKTLLVCLMTLVAALPLSAGHICFFETQHTASCDNRGSMDHHPRGQTPDQCNFCDSTMHSCSTTLDINKEKAVSAAKSPISSIPVYAGISTQMESISFKPDADSILDAVGAAQWALRPIYQKNLRLRC